MSDDWESAAEDLDTPAVIVDKWAGEDVEDEAPERWDEDEDEEKAKKLGATPAPPKPTGPVISKRKKLQLEEKEKADAERAALEAENDPAVRAKKKQEAELQLRKRDAVLAASLLGVDTSDPSYIPPENPRDDGSDIAGGVKSLSLEEAKSIAAASGNSLESFDVTEDVSVERLAAELVKKFAVLQSNSRNSSRVLKFLKTLTVSLSDNLRIDDVAELKRQITTKHEELIKKQRAADKKGKKVGVAGVGTAAALKGKATIKSSANRNTMGEELDDVTGPIDDDEFM